MLNFVYAVDKNYNIQVFTSINSLLKNINQKSGRHPDKLVLEDKTIPIPHNGCKEIPNGTCQSILRQLGINEPLRTFLRDN